MADPKPRAVIVGARPAVLHRDARGDLHNLAGLALVYPDDWGFMRGMAAMPGWVIVAPSTEAITAEENVEVRRCAIESLGWDRFIAEAGLVPVTADHGKNLAAASCWAGRLGEHRHGGSAAAELGLGYRSGWSGDRSGRGSCRGLARPGRTEALA